MNHSNVKAKQIRALRRKAYNKNLDLFDRVYAMLELIQIYNATLDRLEKEQKEE